MLYRVKWSKKYLENECIKINLHYSKKIHLGPVIGTDLIAGRRRPQKRKKKEEESSGDGFSTNPSGTGAQTLWDRSGPVPKESPQIPTSTFPLSCVLFRSPAKEKKKKKKEKNRRREIDHRRTTHASSSPFDARLLPSVRRTTYASSARSPTISSSPLDHRSSPRSLLLSVRPCHSRSSPLHRPPITVHRPPATDRSTTDPFFPRRVL